jgi:hypothetical protein
LALFVFVVRLEVTVRMTALGAQFVAGLGNVPDVVMVALIVMFVGVMFVMLFAVLIVKSFSVSFVVLAPLMMLFVVLVAFVRLRRAALAYRFARQNFGGNGSGRLRWAMTMRITVPMAVIVIFKIFENVADVQKGIAVEADIDKGGLHTGEDAGDAALVDAADQRRLRK